VVPIGEMAFMKMAFGVQSELPRNSTRKICETFPERPEDV